MVMAVCSWEHDGIVVEGGGCGGEISHSFIGCWVLGVVLSFFQGIDWGCGLNDILLG